MNIVKGKIVSVDSNGELSLVKLFSGGLKFTSIVIDTPETAPYLKPDNSVSIIFKENEVILSNGPDCSVSLQNRMPGNVIRVESDKLLSKIVISTSVGNITSIITTSAVKQLGLYSGKNIVAMVKTNEIMLSE
jgi:molybdate transport system regulatory protein